MPLLMGNNKFNHVKILGSSWQGQLGRQLRGQDSPTRPKKPLPLTANFPSSISKRCLFSLTLFGLDKSKAKRTLVKSFPLLFLPTSLHQIQLCVLLMYFSLNGKKKIWGLDTAWPVTIFKVYQDNKKLGFQDSCNFPSFIV